MRDTFTDSQSYKYIQVTAILTHTNAQVSEKFQFSMRLSPLHLSTASVEMPEGAGGVRVTCGAHRVADWIQTGGHPAKALSVRACKLTLIQKYPYRMPGLHSPGCSLFSDSLIIFQMKLSWHHKL